MSVESPGVRLNAITRAARLLRAWERATTLPPWERALLLAGEAVESGEQYVDPGGLRGMPIGHTHRLVLLWRAAQFGPALTVTAGCPMCACVVEFEIGVAALIDSKPIVAGGSLVHGEHTVDWRCPTPEDLIALTDLNSLADEADPLGALRARCVSVRGGDGPLPASAWEVVDRQIAEADPLAEIIVDVVCVECDSPFAASIDPVAFVWAELEAAATRLLHEVDLLARAYGWSETDILALGDPRRAAYLRLVVDGAP